MIEEFTFAALDKIMDKDDRPVFIMLCGLPACGKSTLCNLLDDRFFVISSDNLIEDYAKQNGKTYTDVFREYADQANKLMREQANQALEAHYNVIWDQTNLTLKSRAGKVPDDTYVRIAIIVSCDTETQLARLEARGGGKFIPKHVLESMARGVKIPTRAEGFDYIFEYRT